MICISLALESRRMALADMVTASQQCDLVEIRLDRFAKAPEVGELLAHKRKPVILSCRRVKDGGEWNGSEEERLALLRQCIVSKADYVEIELDAADQIRKFPPAKRVISYTNFQETPPDIADIYAEVQTRQPDVIKLVTLARTPEEAWPLVQILGKPAVPTVVVGLGKPGVMLTLLGRKIGSPWTYAALGKGMETYPGQPTIRELNEVYDYPGIGRSTRFVGVTGFGPRQYATVAVLNAAFRHHNLPTRCLPMGVGSTGLFRKVMEAVHLAGVVVDAEHQTSFLEIATDLEAGARETGEVDLLLRDTAAPPSGEVDKRKGWRGWSTFAPAALAALEAGLGDSVSTGEPLRGRMIMIVGASASARALVMAIHRRGGLITIASRDRDCARQLAQEFQCRHIQFEAIYTTPHEILVICEDETTLPREKKLAAGPLHPGYLGPGKTVMDLTGAGHLTPLLSAAQLQGAGIIPPRAVMLRQLLSQISILTGKETPVDVLEECWKNVLDEDI
jgi:3-dehydroquinate dehydratase / shikimate dehydrogenase